MRTGLATFEAKNRSLRQRGNDGAQEYPSFGICMERLSYAETLRQQRLDSDLCERRKLLMGL